MLATITNGVFSFLNGSVLPALLAAGGIIYFGRTYYKANKIANRNRKIVQNKIANLATIAFPKKDCDAASADGKESNTCAKVSAIDIQQCSLYDSDGELLNPSLYNCYVVQGNSMKYAGINDSDFILVPVDFNLNAMGPFPKILVIRDYVQREGKPLFKVRMAWHRGSIADNLEKAIKEIMAMPKFKRLARQEGYMGAEWMVNDFRAKRLQEYRSAYFKEGVCPDRYKDIVITTTTDAVKKEIHFSIHPASSIVGNVKEAYTI